MGKLIKSTKDPGFDSQPQKIFYRLVSSVLLAVSPFRRMKTVAGVVTVLAASLAVGEFALDPNPESAIFLESI
jgi:hypothetical protein